MKDIISLYGKDLKLLDEDVTVALLFNRHGTSLKINSSTKTIMK